MARVLAIRAPTLGRILCLWAREDHGNIAWRNRRSPQAVAREPQVKRPQVDCISFGPHSRGNPRLGRQRVGKDSRPHIRWKQSHLQTARGTDGRLRDSTGSRSVTGESLRSQFPNAFQGGYNVLQIIYDPHEMDGVNRREV